MIRPNSRHSGQTAVTKSHTQLFLVVSEIQVQAVYFKGKISTGDVAPFSEGTSLQKRSGMARVGEGFHSFTFTPKAFVYPRKD